jgi:hypothetical protein
LRGDAEGDRHQCFATSERNSDRLDKPKIIFYYDFLYFQEPLGNRLTSVRQFEYLTSNPRLLFADLELENPRKKETDHQTCQSTQDFKNYKTLEIWSAMKSEVTDWSGLGDCLEWLSAVSGAFLS